MKVKIPRPVLLGLNLFFFFFSVVWFAGHTSVRLFDWEFWFSLGYFLLCPVNVYYLWQTGRQKIDSPTE